jgi:hypothetical protein
MTTDKLKKELQRLKKIEEQHNDMVTKALVGTTAISEDLAIKVNSAINKSSEVLEQTINTLTEILEEYDPSKVVDAINSQTSSLNNGINKEVVKEMKTLIDEVKELQTKEGFSQKQFNKVFNDGIEKVLNLFVSQNEAPDMTEYARGADGKIRTITEEYDGYTITHKWTYNQNGQLIKVKTTRNELE